MNDLQIDPEFSSLFSPLPAHVYNNLREDIKSNGIRNAIIVWEEENIILDGHNRYSISQELGIEHKIQYLSFSDREKAKRWILESKLSQRNLSPKAISYYRGYTYDSIKGERGGDRKSKGKNDLNAKKAVAQKFGVSERTVINDHKFFSSVNKLETALGVTARENLISGKWKIPLKELQVMAANVEKLKQPDSEPDKHYKDEEMED